MSERICPQCGRTLTINGPCTYCGYPITAANRNNVDRSARKTSQSLDVYDTIREKQAQYRQTGRMGGLRNCRNCGAQIDGKVSFCPYCGTSVSGNPSGLVDQHTADNMRHYDEVRERIENPDHVRCPKCGSYSVQLKKKGYSLGLGCLGFVCCAGPLGLMLGMYGSNDTKRVCLNCGHEW